MMKPFLAKGYAKRKLHTGNQSVQFDEEWEVEIPLFYSTICGSIFSFTAPPFGWVASWDSIETVKTWESYYP